MRNELNDMQFSNTKMMVYCADAMPVGTCMCLHSNSRVASNVPKSYSMHCIKATRETCSAASVR